MHIDRISYNTEYDRTKQDIRGERREQDLIFFRNYRMLISPHGFLFIIYVTYQIRSVAIDSAYITASSPISTASN